MNIIRTDEKQTLKTFFFFFSLYWLEFVVADQIEIVTTKILTDQQDQMSMVSNAASLDTVKKIDLHCI